MGVFELFNDLINLIENLIVFLPCLFISKKEKNLHLIIFFDDYVISSGFF